VAAFVVLEACEVEVVGGRCPEDDSTSTRKQYKIHNAQEAVGRDWQNTRRRRDDARTILPKEISDVWKERTPGDQRHLTVAWAFDNGD